MEPNGNNGIEQFDRDLAEFLASLPRANEQVRVGAEPRRGQRVRRMVRNDLHLLLQEGSDEEEESGGRRRRRRRGRGMYRDLDADDMAAWGMNRRRRRRVGEDDGAGAGAGAAVAEEEVIDLTLGDELVAIVDLARSGEGAGEGAAAGEDGDEELCCIAACCQNPPVFTWLRCCRNEEACIHCVEEHVRRHGWSCPMCRGDMRA
jgi:hypothetical protein